ncbi:helix-turn-helix domain-containing protein [Amycolatopsis marina]|uniref:helix-turn-helix domain-containing protein n=1 Tax=Amycolatopsis marina TaxID=490629 RepID=UPI000B84F883|nr:helix-turn-helix transcriptional regulator [Amycolatopsis marina]
MRGEDITVAGRSSPSFRKRRLGRRLRQLRESAGLTLEEAAPRLDKARSSLHRIENGETRADVHLVRSMMDLYDQYDPGLLDLARDAAKKGWWRQYGLKDFGYVDVETEASRTREFQLINIPGLLQTESYMRPHFMSSYRPPPRDELDNAVAARLYRQQRLTSEAQPMHLHAIVDEAVLRRQVGGVKVMREQLEYLIMASELPTVLLQVIPLGAGSHAAMNGAFDILSFPDPGEPDLFYVEYPTGSMHIEKADQVQEGILLFEHLGATALSPTESVELVCQVLSEST